MKKIKNNLNFNKLNQTYCEKIGNFLESNKRCLIISSKSASSCEQLIKNTQSDFFYTDLFNEVEEPQQLIFLLKQQSKQKKSAEYGSFVFSKNGFNLNPTDLIHSAQNLISRDTRYFDEQLIIILKKLYFSKIVVLLRYGKDVSSSMFETICSICTETSIESKIILIVKDVNERYVNFLCNSNFSKFLSIDYSVESLTTVFTKLTAEQIASLLSATRNDIYETRKIYEYLENSKEFKNASKEVITEVIKNILDKSHTEQEKYVLGAAAHWVNSFSLEELETILRYDFHEPICEEILNKSIEDKIIQKTDKQFEFITAVIKDAFKTLKENRSTKFHLAIARYLLQNDPFNYELRAYHLQSAGNEYVNDITVMKFFNLLHFEKKLNCKIVKEFEDAYGKNLAYGFIEIYKLIEEGKYSEALVKTIEISEPENVTLRREFYYILIFLYWKVGNENQKRDINIKLKQIFEQDCEPETYLLTQLLHLSIVSNNGTYRLDNNCITPESIYQGIKKTLLQYLSKDQCKPEGKFLLNVLLRKSNSVYSPNAATQSVKQSFQFFSETKDLYPKEYFMSGINLVACLLQTSSKSVSYSENGNDPEKPYEYRNPFKLAELLRSELPASSPDFFKAYLENNYLIAMALFADKNIDDDYLEKYASSYKHISTDGQIMILMNCGTLFALKSKYAQADYYWSKAEALNANRDDYYSYILMNNRNIRNISEGKNIQDATEMIPSIMCDHEVMQYIDLHNKIVAKLIKQDKVLSYAEVKEIFDSEFQQKFGGLQLYFYSQPYILSDVQMWSDN